MECTTQLAIWNIFGAWIKVQTIGDSFNRDKSSPLITLSLLSSVSSVFNGTFNSDCSFSMFCSLSLRSLVVPFKGPWSPMSRCFRFEFCRKMSSSLGPTMQRTVGNSIRPWNRPKMQIMKKILKKEVATWLLAVTSKDIASNVEKPPLRTAGAMFSIMYRTFSSESGKEKDYVED